MFPFPSSAAKRARAQALHLLQLADKVDCYRRDVIPAAALGSMRAAAVRLHQLWGDKAADAGKIERACEELHQAMLPCGGSLYPVTLAGDLTEMAVVFAIVVIGIRSFFLQPFKIPTNSMYPSYNGLTPYVYALDQPAPTLAQKTWNFLTLGAVHYDLRAPATGEVTLPIQADNAGQPTFTSPSTTAWSRAWSRLWLFETQQRVCTFYVGQSPVTLQVPVDFENGFEEAFIAEYFPQIYAQDHRDPTALYRALMDHGYLQHTGAMQDNGQRGYVLRTGHLARAGDPVLDFDLRTGDMLFVDRFSYNFISPRVGDPIVFHTAGIDRLVDPQTGAAQADEYYIKRLVGLPGDRLEVRPPVLYRNGDPITGAPAFDLNARRVGEYPGYVNRVDLGPGAEVQVPPNTYFAMGDNSPTSYDSRWWGPVPAQNLMGRAVFIIYPFSPRWGVAK